MVITVSKLHSEDTFHSADQSVVGNDLSGLIILNHRCLYIQLLLIIHLSTKSYSSQILLSHVLALPSLLEIESERETHFRNSEHLLFVFHLVKMDMVHG